MPKITVAIVVLLIPCLLVLIGHPRVGGDYGLAVVFGGIAGAEHDLITCTIQQFLKISGLSNTTVYALMNRGELETVNIGRRRLIVMASYQRLLDRKRGSPAERPLASPPLPKPRSKCASLAG
jgi:hypothetical protein